MSTEPNTIISVTLFQEEWQSSTPRRIFYRGEMIVLTPDEYQDILTKIPEFWNTENDKLVTFRYYSDNTFLCERLKKVYNYSTKEWGEKYYFFKPDAPNELNELVTIFSEYYQNYKIKQIENINAAIMSSVKDTAYVKNIILNSRKKILKDTDYMFLQDYVHPSEEVKSQWISYRQELRDITKQEAWLNNDYANIVFPISPTPKQEFEKLITETENYFPYIFEDFNINEEPTELIVNLMQTISQYVIKTQIISGISKLKLPLFDLSVGTFDFPAIPVFGEDDTEMSFSLFKSKFDDFKKKIDEQFQKLGSTLTIDSILKQMNEKMAEESLSQEVYDIIDELNNSPE